jgi:hypothetical protein
MLFPDKDDAVLKMVALADMPDFTHQTAKLEMHYVCVDGSSVPSLLKLAAT